MNTNMYRGMNPKFPKNTAIKITYEFLLNRSNATQIIKKNIHIYIDRFLPILSER